MTFAIGGQAGGAIFGTVRHVLRRTTAASVAVSYVQHSGWELLRDALPAATLPRLRLVCTDQMGISDPAAVRAMIAAGIGLRCYVGSNVFHPKVIIGHANGQADRFVLGSANLSYSALNTGVEVDVAGDDPDGTLGGWFDALWHDPACCVAFDEARIARLERAFAARLRSRLAARTAENAAPVVADFGEHDASEIVGTILDGVPAAITPLNFDKAGNNVRTLSRIIQVLTDQTQLRGKAASEFKLLGLAVTGHLTALGRAAAADRTPTGIAALWMGWLKRASMAELIAVSPSGQLIRARNAFATFWQLSDEVTAYYIAKSTSPTVADKRLLQTIELLANAGRPLPGLTLADLAALTPLLSNTGSLPPAAAAAVRSYLGNKGARGWNLADRRLAVEAWRAA